MRGFERREQGDYPYFKLATWDAHSLTWRDGKTSIPSEEEARRQARKPGRYRISRVDASGRTDLECFTV